MGDGWVRFNSKLVIVSTEGKHHQYHDFSMSPSADTVFCSSVLHVDNGCNSFEQLIHWSFCSYGC